MQKVEYMASQDLLKMLNRCVTDKQFCKLLLTEPAKAVQNYRLDEAEQTALLTISASDFISLVGKLKELGFLVTVNK